MNARLPKLCGKEILQACEVMMLLNISQLNYAFFKKENRIFFFTQKCLNSSATISIYMFQTVFRFSKMN